MPQTDIVPDFVQEAEQAVTPEDRTRVRFVAAEAVLHRVFRCHGQLSIKSISFDLDELNDMPAAVRSHATIVREDGDSDPVAFLPIQIAAAYALGYRIEAAPKGEDF